MQQGVNSWSVVFQLHGPGDATPEFPLGSAGSPSFALYANSKFQINLNGGDLALGANPYVTNYLQTYDFSDGGSLNLGKWSDFIIRINHAQTPTGSVTVWRRNEGQSAFTKVMEVFNVPTLQFRSTMRPTAGVHYWKQGLYREDNSATITNVLWMGPLAKGTSFKAVKWAAFGTTAGQP